jgi:hypothetical protein
MHNERTSIELLAHFDHPKTCDLQLARWAAESEPREEAADEVDRVDIDQDRSALSHQTTKRGIGWVLKWAAAAAILMIAASVLAQFAYVLAAEHKLNLAARAAVLEATLPHASTDTVKAVLKRRLANSAHADHLQLTILQNGKPNDQHIRQSDGDRFSVSVSMPKSDAVPRWTKLFCPTHDDLSISAHAERQIPGRKVPYIARSQTAAE